MKSSAKIKQSKIIFVYTTFPSKKVANQLIRKLVELNLIACANLWGPIESTYRWKSKIESGKEFSAILKLPKKNYKALQQYIENNHPYEVPCILGWIVDFVNPSYERFICASCKEK